MCVRARAWQGRVSGGKAVRCGAVRCRWQARDATARLTPPLIAGRVRPTLPTCAAERDTGGQNLGRGVGEQLLRHVGRHEARCDGVDRDVVARQLCR